jgi:hypothetical protein
MVPPMDKRQSNPALYTLAKPSENVRVPMTANDMIDNNMVRPRIEYLQQKKKGLLDLVKAS